MRRLLCIAVVSCLALVAGCGSDDGGGDSTTSATATQTTPTQTTTDESTTKLPHGSEPVKLDPADFTTKIDNPYYPLAPNDQAGRRWIYQSTEERIVVTVTEETKDIQGVTARVITDVVTNRNGGGFVEVTKDWYSQDNDGNVWYLGEDTKEYETARSPRPRVPGSTASTVPTAGSSCGRSAARPDLSPGVLQGRGRGSREGGHSGREGDGSVRDLRERPQDRGLETVGARCR